MTETPEDYLKVKKNLRLLSDCKIAAGSSLPFLSLSFVITSRNYSRFSNMIEIAHEVGADRNSFRAHCHPGQHGGSRPQRGTIPRTPGVSAGRAQQGGGVRGAEQSSYVGAVIPPYMPSKLIGPPVVPCYVGWYFSVILGNGSVMPCCQCAAPIGQVTDKRRFADIWASAEYQEFRTAAKSLPETSDRLVSCECDNCQLRPRKMALQNFLDPLNRIDAGAEVQTFTTGDFVRKLQGRHGHEPSS